MFSDLVSVGLTVCAEPLRITAKSQTCLFWYHLRWQIFKGQWTCTVLLLANQGPVTALVKK
jgi:hypothetical protein